MSISNYLRSCQKSLRGIGELEVSRGILFVIGNESADLDSCVSSIAYGYLQSYLMKPQRTVIPVMNLPRADVALRRELALLLKSVDVLESDLICRDELPDVVTQGNNTQLSFVLVDHNHFTVKGLNVERIHVDGILDHHVDEGLYQTASPRTIQPCGSCTSLVVNHFRDSWQTSQLDGEVELTKLALSTILVDTSKLTNQVTETDQQVVQFLESRVVSTQGWNMDQQFKRLRDAKRDNSDLEVAQLLRRDYKEWDLGPDVGFWGVSSITLSLDDLVAMENWDRDMKRHGSVNHLDVHMVMTKHGDKELYVHLINSEKLPHLQKFIERATSQMSLTPWKKAEITGPPMYAFQQGDLTATRKKVATICQSLVQ